MLTLCIFAVLLVLIMIDLPIAVAIALTAIANRLQVVVDLATSGPWNYTNQFVVQNIRSPRW